MVIFDLRNPKLRKILLRGDILDRASWLPPNVFTAARVAEPVSLSV